MPDYKVKQGDCISSIAQGHGIPWEKIWNHPKNANLQQTRKDPNVLYPGDLVFIPEKEEKQESGATERRHRFRKKGTPAVLRLQILDEEGNPRAGVNYTLQVDGQYFEETTDEEGKIEQRIPPGAKKGTLLLKDDDPIPLVFGQLDPIEAITGIQQRLLNLGFDCGEVNGNLDSKTQEALKEFQRTYGLNDSGNMDQATKDKLFKQHGS